MKKSVEQVKKGAVLVAFASMCSSAAIANGSELTNHTNHTPQTEEKTQIHAQHDAHVQAQHDAHVQAQHDAHVPAQHDAHVPAQHDAHVQAQHEHPQHLQAAHHEKEAPLVTVTDAEKAKLSKGQVVIGTADKPNGRRWVTAKIKINAQPHVVWEAVHEERKTNPDLAYSKVLEEGKNEAGKNEQTLEQKFQLIPVLGTSVCVIKSTEDLHRRIDYHLLKSDRFKAVEGSWLLQPTEDGTTILELGSYIDIGVPAPRTFIEGIAGKKLERRLYSVRKVAENHVSKTPLAQHSNLN